METIKLNFVDFWSDLDKKNNFFTRILSTKYKIVIDEKYPDILFFSSYGNNYLKYNCIKIFYTGENKRPDFTGCDFAISFDYLKNKKHFRLPLYWLYIDELSNRKELLFDRLFSDLSDIEVENIWSKKTKFCCFLVSNPQGKKRSNFFKNLNKIKSVDSGGKYLNNIGIPIEDKLDFIKNYKFVISFENSSFPGYTTEKILEPLLVGSIPIYWGNPVIFKDINSETFINYSSFKNENDLIDFLLKLDNGSLSVFSFYNKSIISKANFPSMEAMKLTLLEFLNNIILNRSRIKAKSNSKYYDFLHFLKRKYLLIAYLLNAKIKSVIFS